MTLPSATLARTPHRQKHISQVVAIFSTRWVPLHPGGMNAILKPLTKAEINIHYLYTTINRIGEETIVILGVDKIDEAREVLQRNWIHLIEDEIYSL